MELKRYLANEAATLCFGQALAKIISAPMVVFLRGELGAGKTALTRALLQQLGCPESVKSPTYTLVEEYHFPEFTVFHFDLYRVKSLAELSNIGFSEYFHSKAICIIEWPELASSLLMPDLSIDLSVTGEGRSILLNTQHSDLEQKLSICLS
jgi:tRNA threonylcarbamoyladenosine biosynthesis protein TsaE